MTINNMWRTKDLYLAAYIYSQQIELIKVERENNICWFYFNNVNHCGELQALYWANKGNTVPKLYADATKNLKDLIFAT
jgi:hypothetical protein